jgi:pimeloyl-ACP methyl ester carboxylesterase
MLPKAPAEVAIESVTGDYNIGGGRIHARVLNGPRFHDRSRPLRTAMFIHGGGLGSNFTQIERPARWLIARELFDQVILPDRRGSGGSSPLVRRFDLSEQADDLRRMLDRMNVYDPLTVLGLDTGGPLGLTLAGLDSRVQRVVLVASGFMRNEMNGLTRWLLRIGVLRPLLDWEIRRSIGRREPQPVNFDPAYDAHSVMEMAQTFRQVIQTIPSERVESLRVASAAELDAAAVSVPPDLTLQIPILQVIGELDEVWGGALPEDVARRFPNVTSRKVPGALIHKDVFFKSESYYQVLFDLLQEAL